VNAVRTNDPTAELAGAADAEATGPGARVPVLATRGLAKSFGQTQALRDGTLEVYPGDIVALLGENGSGKSTLVKLLAGVYRPDAGTLVVDGEPVRFAGPRQSLAAGIVTIFQEILACRDRSVLDNLWLGNGPARRTARLDAGRRQAAAAVWRSLAGQEIDLDAPVGELSLMQQQICVIARALLREPRVLVLDESTSTLDVTLRDRLFEELRRRCADGMAALFISHRMDEVMTLADEYVALRSGSVVGTRRRGGASADDLLELISGASVLRERHRVHRPAARDQVIFRGDAIRLRPGRSPFDVTVRKGEIVGLAGLEGHGQDEFLRILAGLHKPSGGRLEVDAAGRLEPVTSYRAGVSRGVVYVPRDRKVEGMADVLSILDNYSLPTLRRDTRLGLVRTSSTRRRFRKDAGTVNFVPGRQESIGRLSGGNQQKVIVARWLAGAPRVILLNDPTRGVDLKTKQELYDVFRRLADEGTTVVMLSSEVDELVHLMDRVLVFHDGSLSAELDADDVSPARIVAAYFGAPTTPTEAPR
jgi:ABC-type sugar transport system ATPase subunit